MSIPVDVALIINPEQIRPVAVKRGFRRLRSRSTDIQEILLVSVIAINTASRIFVGNLYAEIVPIVGSAISYLYIIAAVKRVKAVIA